MRRWSVLAVCALALSGCGPADGAAVEIEERFVDAGSVRLFFPPGEEPCAGTAAFLDDMVQRITSFLELPRPERLEYHFKPDGDLTKVCGTAVSYAGCSFPGELRLWSRDATSVHELVHAVADQDGTHYSFLAEGLATALGEENIWLFDYDAPESEYLTPGLMSPADQGGLAGDFVSYLLAEQGPARFMELYASVPHDASAEQFKAIFAETYGLSFDELLAARRDATQRFRQNRLLFPECSFPLMAFDGDTWSSEQTVDCAADAVGPSIRLSAITSSAWKAQTLEIAGDGEFRIEFSGTGGGAMLQHCQAPYERWSLTSDNSPLQSRILGQHSLTWGRLAALFTHADERAEPATVSLAITPAPELAACTAAEPRAIEDDVDGVYAIADADAARHVPFELGARRTATAAFQEVELCNDECAECAPVPMFEGSALEPGIVYALSVGADPYRQAEGVQLAAE